MSRPYTIGSAFERRSPGRKGKMSQSFAIEFQYRSMYYSTTITIYKPGRKGSILNRCVLCLLLTLRTQAGQHRTVKEGVYEGQRQRGEMAREH